MAVEGQWDATIEALKHHRRIIWALSLREVVTRYGRDNIGFLWVIGEPLLFCAAVSTMWSIIKPGSEHGLKIVAFTVTGYMPLLLVRHVLQHGMYALQVNTPLLYHRQISVLHLFLARSIVEVVGVTFAFIVIGAILIPFSLLDFPVNLGLVYMGWFLLAWMGFGLAILFGSLFELFEPIERFVTVITYLMVPLSGTFYMAAWIPPPYRDYVLLIPFVNTEEMVRGGFFGSAVHAYYDVPYTIAWAAGFTVVGLLLSTFTRSRVYVE